MVNRHHHRNEEHPQKQHTAPPVVVGLQPSALVDHVARVDWSLLDTIPGDRGGSIPVGMEEVELILSQVRGAQGMPSDGGEAIHVRTIAGGSILNTVRGLSAGFGVPCGIIGARGDDRSGRFFARGTARSRLDLSRLRVKPGPTGQCACLVDADGNRTMRPCLSGVAKLQASELKVEDFSGSKWLLLRYAYLNLECIQAAIWLAKQEGLYVSMDLASFEMVRNYRLSLLALLEAGCIDLCFANESEAKELVRGEEKADAESALEFLGRCCKWAVVTLGPKGCIAKHGKEVIRISATGETHAVDTTGAGDLFASGFLYGLVKGLSLEDCCKIGTCSGGSVIRSLGGEVIPENWHWMYKQMQSRGFSVPDIL